MALFRHRPAVALIAATSLVWGACAGLSAPEPPADLADGGSADPESDSGSPADAGRERDGGPGIDAGVPPDAGAWPDGGRTDAGAADAGPPGRDLSSDRTRFFGLSRCNGSGLQLCESFEAPTLDTATWTVPTSGVTLGTAEHARGGRALHVLKVGNGAAFIRETKTFPALHNTYFGRMFVKFISLPKAPMTYSHWALVAATGTVVSGEIRLQGNLLTSGHQRFSVGTDNRVDPNGTGDWGMSDNDPTGNPREVPLNEWVCLEWMHKGDTNETRFWWDAIEHPSMHTTSSVHGGNSNPFILPQFNAVKIGWQEYQPSTETFELWVDEIAIDPRRIGCVD